MTQPKNSYTSSTQPSDLQVCLKDLTADVCAGQFSVDPVHLLSPCQKKSAHRPTLRLSITSKIFSDIREHFAIEPVEDAQTLLCVMAAAEAARDVQLWKTLREFAAQEKPQITLAHLRDSRVGVPTWQELFRKHQTAFTKPAVVVNNTGSAVRLIDVPKGDRHDD